MRRLLLLLLVVVFTTVARSDQSMADLTDSASDLAYQHLAEVMDEFIRTFDVYTDGGAGGNHFVHRARMPEGAVDGLVTIDDISKESVFRGATAIKNTYSPSLGSWGGIYFQNGILPPGNRQPKDNWGTHPGAGVDLRGATELTFWARAAGSNANVEFFAFGVGRDAEKDICAPIAPNPDSECKVTTCGRVDSHADPRCFVTLTQSWQEFKIDLTGLDLSYVLGGFGWVADKDHNPQDITFYLDDIQYDKARPDELRFPCSYVTLPTNDKDFDTVLRNVSFTYDNAIALLAFLARGKADDLRRAELLADAFVYAQAHDRLYDDLEPRDGLFRNAYQCGDLISPPGWTPNGLVGTARMPGWWNVEAQEWNEDPVQVGSHTGNVLWAMIGLVVLPNRKALLHRGPRWARDPR